MQTHLCYTQKKSHTKNCYVVMLMSYWSKTDQIYIVMLYTYCGDRNNKPLIRTRTSIQLTSDANKKFTNITISKSEVRKQTFKLFFFFLKSFLKFTVYVSSPMKQIISQFLILEVIHIQSHCRNQMVLQCMQTGIYLKSSSHQ